MQKYKNSILLLVVILIVVAGGSVWYKKNHDGNTHEKVKVSQVDLKTAEGNNRLPENFPQNIPIQSGNLTDSYKLEYPDRGVIVSGVTFQTFQTPFELYENYLNFIKSNDFVVDEDKSNRESGVLVGVKKGDTIMVIISNENSENKLRSVQVVYTSNNNPTLK